jgi:hypothetical protein
LLRAGIHSRSMLIDGYEVHYGVNLTKAITTFSDAAVVGRQFVFFQSEDCRVKHGLLEIRTRRRAYQFFAAVFASLDMSIALLMTTSTQNSFPGPSESPTDDPGGRDSGGPDQNFCPGGVLLKPLHRWPLVPAAKAANKDPGSFPIHSSSVVGTRRPVH